MVKYYETVGAGNRAENEVYTVLRKYTRFVYRNCRVDTLFTKQGNTEIDIIAAIADVILIVEVKNMRSIEGTLESHYWSFEGMETGREFTSLNVFTQNRIHIRSFKDAWFIQRKVFPTMISLVVVPNGCQVSRELRSGGLIEVKEFELQLARMSAKFKGATPRYGYAMEYFVGGDGAVITRPDFAGR